LDTTAGRIITATPATTLTFVATAVPSASPVHTSMDTGRDTDTATDTGRARDTDTATATGPAGRAATPATDVTVWTAAVAVCDDWCDTHNRVTPVQPQASDRAQHRR